MGVIYFVGCKKCGIYRDLDKFYTLHFCGEIKDRKKALELADKEVKKDSFRCALLLSFLSQHYGHDIVLFDDCGDFFEYTEMKEENIDFWSLTAYEPPRQKDGGKG